MRFYKGRERASQPSNSSHIGTALTEIAPHACALSALDHEPAVRPRPRLMGHPLSFSRRHPRSRDTLPLPRAWR